MQRAVRSLICWEGAPQELLELLRLAVSWVTYHSVLWYCKAWENPTSSVTPFSTACWSGQLRARLKKLMTAVFRPDLGFGCEVSAFGRLQQDAEGGSVVRESGTTAPVLMVRILLCGCIQSVSISDDTEWPGKEKKSMSSGAFVWSAGQLLGWLGSCWLGWCSGRRALAPSRAVPQLEVTAGARCSRRKPTLPAWKKLWQSTFDNQPFKRVYYENTALLILWNSGFGSVWNVAFLSTLKAWIN